MKDFAQWDGFSGSRWKEKINVRDFIRHNYTPYDGDDSFLEGPTEATDKLWEKLQELQKAERANNGVLDMETKVVTKGSRTSDRQASEACIYALWRNQDG